MTQSKNPYGRTERGFYFLPNPYKKAEEETGGREDLMKQSYNAAT